MESTDDLDYDFDKPLKHCEPIIYSDNMGATLSVALLDGVVECMTTWGQWLHLMSAARGDQHWSSSGRREVTLTTSFTKSIWRDRATKGRSWPATYFEQCIAQTSHLRNPAIQSRFERGCGRSPESTNSPPCWMG